MLLRNKTMTCTVPVRKTGTLQHASAPSFDMEVPAGVDGPVIYKLLVFRIPESTKTNFRVALLKNNLDIQHTFEAFVDIFISWTNGEKYTDVMKAVVRRSVTLMNGV